MSHIEAVWISGICKLYIYETSEDFGNKTQQKWHMSKLHICKIATARYRDGKCQISDQ